MFNQTVSSKYLIEITHHHSTSPTFLHSYITTFLHSSIPPFLHSYIPSFLHSYIPIFLHSIIHHPSFIIHHSLDNLSIFKGQSNIRTLETVTDNRPNKHANIEPSRFSNQQTREDCQSGVWQKREVSKTPCANSNFS